MKTRFLLLALFAACAFMARPVLAQIDIPAEEQIDESTDGLSMFRPETETGTKPALTPPLRVAMIYYRFCGATPDYADWARLNDAYIKAEDYEKMMVESTLKKDFEETYKLITPNEEMVVDFRATLSDYMVENEGYIVENFTSKTFFPLIYGKDNFAIIVKDLVEREWLPAKDLAAKGIHDLRKASENGKDVTITFRLTPVYADKDFTFTAEDKTWRLLGAKIEDMVIYDAKGDTVWSETQKTDPVIGQEKNELMNLYR